jgi:hypothetical protein
MVQRWFWSDSGFGSTRDQLNKVRKFRWANIDWETARIAQRDACADEFFE